MEVSSLSDPLALGPCSPDAVTGPQARTPSLAED